MEILVKAAQLLLSLSFLIILHELGHFIPARWFKVRVEKFYLFFDAGFSLFKFKKGDTEYGIGWLPLGGYVKIAGMIDESMDSDQIAEEPKDDEFRSKPAWQRLVIMIGGVTVNLLLGIFIYMMIVFAWGKDYVAPGDTLYGFAPSETMRELGFQNGDRILELDGVVPFNILDVTKEIMFHDTKSIKVAHSNGSVEVIDIPEGTDMTLFKNDERALSPRIKYTIIRAPLEESPAYISGLKENDKIIAIDGEEIVFWDQITSIVKTGVKNMGPSKTPYTAVLKVMRGDSVFEVSIQTKEGLLGVGIHSPDPEDETAFDKYTYKRSHKDYGFGESISEGFTLGIATLSDYITQFKFVFTKKGSTGIGGFGAIGNLFPGTWDWLAFWEKTAFISIMLAFMNLLPIPALDGGHVMFLIYEMISGKAPSDKFLMRAQVIGMVLLLSLMLYANGLDIYKAIFG